MYKGRTHRYEQDIRIKDTNQLLPGDCYCDQGQLSSKQLFPTFVYICIQARDEFKNEYEILSQLLPHPSILQLHAFFYDRMDPDWVPGIKQQNRSISLFMVMDYHTLDMEENIKDLCAHRGPKVRLYLLMLNFLIVIFTEQQCVEVVHSAAICLGLP